MIELNSECSCTFGTQKTVLLSLSHRYFAVTHGRRVQVWHAPGHTHDYSPFSLYRSFPGQYDETLCLDWSQDSK